MKIKYNLDVFLDAAERVDDGHAKFACCALSDAAFTAGHREENETELFRQLYGVTARIETGKPYTFMSLAHSLGYTDITDSELHSIRVLSILFAREIARDKNRQGTHSARTAKREAARKQKELEKRAAAEFAAVKNQIDSIESDLTVDLRTCKPGDKLLSKHGEILTYVKHCPECIYPHRVEYANGSWGSRLDNGWTYKNNRLPSDDDIVKILGQ